MSSARTQAGNLAHALKTPLSVLANAADGKDEALARLVVAQVEMARKQVDYHLARAQAAAAVRLPGARTPLNPIVDGLVRTMRRIHAERNLELVVQPIPATWRFGGEEQDLQEMLGNLLDNACGASRRVEIDARIEQDRLVIRALTMTAKASPRRSVRTCSAAASGPISRFPAAGSGWPSLMIWHACMAARYCWQIHRWVACGRL
jgi:signal transduction histidine kinase